jgi:hypothetical protein
VAKPPALAPAGLDHPVLALEPATEALWNTAATLELTVDQLATLSSLAARSTVKTNGVYTAHFRDVDPLGVARGQATPARRPPPASPWLNAAASAGLAGTALSAWVGERYLADLPAQGAEIKAALTAIPAKLSAPADPRLKTLAQDLSRFGREARDNYAAAVAKPQFVQKVIDAATQARGIQAALGEPFERVRAELERLSKAPRFGEVQLEKTVVQLRELQGQRRVQDAALRILAGLERVRLALGDDSSAEGGSDTSLQALCDNAAAGIARDKALIEQLRACEAMAQGSAYVGKGEFVANRAHARTLFDKIESEPSELALQALADVADARSRGFLDGQARRWSLLFRIDEQGQVNELRHMTHPA